MGWCGFAPIEVALAARTNIESGGNLAEPIWVHGDVHGESQLSSPIPLQAESQYEKLA